MCSCVWAPGPAWNPNQEKKSRCSQRAGKPLDSRACLCATWQQWDQVGMLEILKKEKHSPWAPATKEGRFSLGEPFTPAHSPSLQEAWPGPPHPFQEGRGGTICWGLAPRGPSGNVCPFVGPLPSGVALLCCSRRRHFALSYTELLCLREEDTGWQLWSHICCWEQSTYLCLKMLETAPTVIPVATSKIDLLGMLEVGSGKFI